MNSIWNRVQENPKTSAGVGILMFLVFALTLTLGLVWSDYIYGWGLLRKRYPGESCKVKIGGVHNCLDQLNCLGGTPPTVVGSTIQSGTIGICSCLSDQPISVATPISTPIANTPAV